jgi:hypothetical protein
MRRCAEGEGRKRRAGVWLPCRASLPRDGAAGGPVGWGRKGHIRGIADAE